MEREGGGEDLKRGDLFYFLWGAIHNRDLI